MQACISVTNRVPTIFVSDIDSYLSQECLLSLTQDFIRGKKSYDFLKLSKKAAVFGHIFQILIIFKILFVALKGHIDGTKLSLKWFLSSTNYLVTMIFFWFFPLFWALNLENSYLRNVLSEGQIFSGYQLKVCMMSKCDMNQKFLSTPLCDLCRLHQK